MKIGTVGIVGAGALGAFYADKLKDAATVRVLAHGARLERLQKHGVVVNGRAFSLETIDAAGSSAPVDLLIVTVKDMHLDEAIADMRAAVGPRTVILSLMNGIDSEDRLKAAYPANTVLYGISVGIDATREGNAVVVGSEGKVMFGEARNAPPSEAVKAVADLLGTGGVTYEIPEDMLRTLWWKFMVNVGINTLSSILRAPYAAFQHEGEARSLLRDGMREVISVARAKGIALEESDIPAFLALLDKLSPVGKTSMLQDVEAGRKTEIDMLSGRLCAIGRETGVPTPINDVYLRIIRALEPADA
jgi:2-dehydropantoate 2-reductase